MLRGDHRVNEIKLAQRARRRLPPGASGGVRGPHRARPASSGRSARDVADPARPRRSRPARYVIGANRPDAHLRGVEPGRDFAFERADIRTVEAGDTVDGHPIRIEPAIEVGNIFKLGTRFSEPLGATYLDEAGASS